MRVTIEKLTALDINELITKSTSTINRTIRNFCGEEVSDSEKFNDLLARTRQVKGLIRNDADSTARMIEMRPEQEDHYRELWSHCAMKLLDECSITLVKLIDKEWTPLIEDNGVDISPEDMDKWLTPKPKQETKPTPLEAAGEGGETPAE